MMQEVDRHVKQELDARAEALERHFGGDVVYYTGMLTGMLVGQVYYPLETLFREFLERLKGITGGNLLVFFLNTNGGSAETVEKLVEIIRFHYRDVFFVVPDRAMSAGTIFCMSGDRIYMDYSSSLGPIDPQVFNGKDWVPALGYLDYLEKLIEKSRNGTLTDAEMLILQNQDLGTLTRYEQAKNLTITLLKKWLVEYKFKEWTTHGTNPAKKDRPVTLEEKRERAEEIARMLSDNKLWHSHNRMIGVETIKKVLKLKVEDYSTDDELRPLIRTYSDFLTDYVTRYGHQVFIHCRHF